MNILHNEQFLFVTIKFSNRSRHNFNLLCTCMPKIDRLFYKSLRVYESKRALNIKVSRQGNKTTFPFFIFEELAHKGVKTAEFCHQEYLCLVNIL